MTKKRRKVGTNTEKSTEGRERRLRNLRPPWKPGESGNPSGRPKSKPLTDACLKRLSDHPKDLDAVARALITQAKRGSVKAFSELADRLEGKPASHDAIDLSVNYGEELIRRINAGLERVRQGQEQREREQT